MFHTSAHPSHLEVRCEFPITNFMMHMEKLVEPCRSGHKLNLPTLKIPLLVVEAITTPILN
jgi:hypothetical protein